VAHPQAITSINTTQAAGAVAAVGTTAEAVGGEAVTVGAALAAAVGVGVVVTAVGVAVAGADRP